MRLRIRLERMLLAVTLVGLVSCTDGAGPVLPIEGTWFGEGDRYSLRLAVLHEDGRLQGYGGVVRRTEDPANWEMVSWIVGNYVQPDVFLTLGGSESPTRTFEGRVGRSSMTGTLTTPDSGLVEEFTLKRVCGYTPPREPCP